MQPTESPGEVPKGHFDGPGGDPVGTTRLIPRPKVGKRTVKGGTNRYQERHLEDSRPRDVNGRLDREDRAESSNDPTDDHQHHTEICEGKVDARRAAIE